MKLAEVAAKIDEHLKRLEKDPKWNVRKSVDDKHHLSLPRLWNSGAWVAGRYVLVIYVSYQGHAALSKSEAVEYLQWLDAGNKGQHYVMKYEKAAAGSRTK